MKERPMIFNAEMVRALLSGRKTQTRRIIKPQPEATLSGSLSGKWLSRPLNGLLLPKIEDIAIHCPFGAVGDRIWVRESFYEHGHYEGGGYDPEDSYFVSEKQVLYPADGVKRPSQRERDDFWLSRPSIHMPRWASRILLEITGVRVERLNAISPEDAESEGLERTNFTGFGDEPGLPSYPEPDVYFDPLKKQWKEYPPEAFAGLWEYIYGEGSWQANPWVWVIAFRRINP